MRNKKLFGWLVTLVAVLLLLPAVHAHAEPADQGTTYYIDSNEGSDEATGTSQAQAWKSLDKVNGTVFQPGDRILFKAGSVFVGHLYPAGSGSAGAPIVIDMYGTGPKPMIMADGRNESIVSLKNQPYWHIRNLDINGANLPGVKYGINIIVEDFGQLDHIYITDNYLHDIAGDLTTKVSGGIFLTISGTSIKSWFHHVRIENNTVRHTDRTGITLDAFRSWEDKRLGTYEPGTWVPCTDVVIRGNFLDDVGGDGIVMKNCEGGIVEYNTAKNCNARATDANVAIWVYNSTNCVMQFNEAYNTRYTHDGEGFDVDSFSENTLVQYNYSHDNEGGFILICAPGEVGTGAVGYYTRDTVVRYNISQNDGNLGLMLSGNTYRNYFYNNTIYTAQGSKTAIVDTWDWGSAWPYECYFYNNLIYNLGTGDYDLGQTGITFSNNLMYGNHPMSEPEDPFKITDDPMLISPGSGGVGMWTVDGYMLKKGSPALTAGMAIENAGGRDYFGFAIDEQKPNIGAYGGAGLEDILSKNSEDTQSVSYIEPVYVSVTVGAVPDMPVRIPVRMQDGTQKLIAVEWETVQPYEKTGSYRVKGTLKGSDLEIIASVTAVNAVVENFEKITVTNMIPSWQTGGEQTASYLDPINHAGKYCLTQFARTAFEATAQQTVTDLPAGTYDFSCYVKSNGTHENATVTVKADQDHVLQLGAYDSFQKLELKDISITGGQCQIIIATSGNAESYVQIDTLRLYRQDAYGTNMIANADFDIFDTSLVNWNTETRQTYAVMGTPQIDGQVDDIWLDAISMDVDTRNFSYVSGNRTTVSANARLMWDKTHLYVLAVVKDPVISYSNQSFAYFRDSTEVVIDERNVKEGRNIEFNETCGQWRVGAKENDLSGYGPGYSAGFDRFSGASSVASNGYVVEMAVPFTELQPMVGDKIGFEIQINDDNGAGSRTGIICWNSASGNSWQYTDVLGTVVLVGNSSQIELFAGDEPVELTEEEKLALETASNTDMTKYRPVFIIGAAVILCITALNVILTVKQKKSKGTV